MKKAILIPLFIFPLFASAQIPVTDGVSAGILTSINIQAVLRNKILTKQMANQQKIILQNKTIISLLRKQNNIVKHTDELKTEEIRTYKEAPDSSIIQYQLYDLEKVKDEIVLSAKGFMNLANNLEHITQGSSKVSRPRSPSS